MKFKKWLFLPLALVLVLGVLFMGGCQIEGPQGPAGTVDEDALQEMVEEAVQEQLAELDTSDLNIEVKAECCVAELVILSESASCPDPDDWFMVFGSGFDAEERVTVYFLNEGNPELKWFRVDTNESGAFAWCGSLPSYSEFNEDMFKDITPTTDDDDCPCGEDMWLFTVGAYVGNNLEATHPMYISGD